MAGYSGTPLGKKLGMKSNFTVKVKNEPEEYWDWMAPLPEGMKIATRSKKESLDFAHLFVKTNKTFEKEFIKLRDELKKTGMLWISWPKKSSGVVTDLNENIIRDFGLTHGLVDVKVCAVDEVWSGLKFMYRLKDR